jgi:hypothetical protein
MTHTITLTPRQYDILIRTLKLRKSQCLLEAELYLDELRDLENLRQAVWVTEEEKAGA